MLSGPLPVHAQEEDAPIYAWADTETVEVSSDMMNPAAQSPLVLTIREGESATYYLRLSKQPVASGWWVRVHVDGYVRYDGEYPDKGVRWTPSVGWEVQRTVAPTDDPVGPPTQWRGVTIYGSIRVSQRHFGAFRGFSWVI